MKLSHCRSCGAPIIWTITSNGKRMPVDADPVRAERGFRLDEELIDEAQMGFNGSDLQAGKDMVATFTQTPAADERLYQSHFSTCADANRWRT